MSNALDIPVPEVESLEVDLRKVRHHGIVAVRELDLPGLKLAARAAGRVEPHEPVGSYVIERLLGDSAARIGGEHGELAATLYGLTPETRGGRPSALRRMAAEDAHVSTDHFRHTYEPRLRAALADQVLAEIHDYRLRLARLRMDVRIPTHSRLAVEWLTRFEAMYRMWTPLTGVGGDLTAFRSTLLEEDRPWDKAGGPHAGGDADYTQERQAAGYVTFALAHFACFLAELRDFETRFGGVWLLPEAQAETDLREAVHRAMLASPNNERDNSFVRSVLTQVPGREMHGFLQALADSDAGRDMHSEWQAWANTCKCTWELGSRVGRGYFPTHLTCPRISLKCDMHILIAACNDFCLILDDAWDAIADWYHDVPKPVRVDRTAEEITAARGSSIFEHLKEDSES